MAIKTTAREMAPSGNKHEHIAWLKWMDPDTKAGGWKTRADMVAYVEKNGTESVWCPDRDPSKKGAWVHVNHNDYVKYVQTVADGRWTDNLLSLPEMTHGT
jgi:hypothetical protein